jgi:cytochrome b6-f complex iron-sulfur subunit
MTRKEFIAQVGAGAAILFIPACITGLSSCKKKDTSQPKKVDFTLDVSSGPLATNGGALINNGVIVARSAASGFIAVDAACTHEGTNIDYVSSSNSFKCPNHGATYDANGNVTLGPATKSLTSYHCTLTGTSLRVYS